MSCSDAITGGDYVLAQSICESAAQTVNEQDELSTDKNNELIETWLHLVEISHELGEQDKEAYYLAKIKSHPFFSEHIEVQYQWNRRVGQKFYFLGNYKSAKQYLTKGLSIAVKENNPVWLSKSHNDVGLTDLKLIDYPSSLDHFKQSLALKLVHGNAYQVGKTLNNIALVYVRLEDHIQAIDFYEQALDQYLTYAQLPDFDERVFSYISHLYEDLTKAHSLQGNAAEAQKYALKIVDTFKQKNSPRAQARALINIGQHHLALEQYASANLFYQEAAEIYQQNQLEMDVDYYYNIAQIEYKTGQTDSAIQSAEHGLVKALAVKDHNKTSQFYGLLASIHEHSNKVKALNYIQQQQQFRELFLQAKYDQDLSNVKHQIEKQKIQHDLTSEQLASANKSAKLQRLNQTILTGILIFIIILIGLFSYGLNKRKERKALLKTIKNHKQQLFLMQNQNLTLKDESVTVSADELRHSFKLCLVSTMLDALTVWEKTTGLDRIELAERSKVWTVSIDNGTLRTRSFDKYLDIDKIPNNPRWRNVVKTSHFILTCDEISLADRHSMEQQLDSLLELVKQFSLHSSKE